MKAIVNAGFAGVLLDHISVVTRRGKASPIRIGSRLPGGVPTADIISMPDYSFEIWQKAFEDYSIDDSWRSYPRKLKQEASAEQMAPYALAHLKSGYHDIDEVISSLQQTDAKRLELVAGIPKSDGSLGPQPSDQEVETTWMIFRTLTDLDRTRKSQIEGLTDRLLMLRLRVTGGLPLGGSCEICRT